MRCDTRTYLWKIGWAETEPHDEVKDTMPSRLVDQGLNRLGITHSFRFQLSKTIIPRNTVQ